MKETQAAYRLYLQSEHWRGLRLLAISRDRGKCRRCRRPAVEVHHKFYRATWEETRLDDLESLCWFHHRRAHRIPVAMADKVKFRPGMYEGKPAGKIGAAYALNLRPSFAE